MTLPVSGPISMLQIANEVGLAPPISINHPWFLQLIGKSGFPISFSDFYGKTGRYDVSSFCIAGAEPFIPFPNPPFFGGTLIALQGDNGDGTFLFFRTDLAAPNWSGNIKAINNTTGASCVMPKTSSTTWGGAVGKILRPGQTDSITILPSN